MKGTICLARNAGSRHKPVPAAIAAQQCQMLQQGRAGGRLRAAESPGPTKLVGGERVELPTSSV